MTVTCVDGSIVLRPQDCLNGFSGATSSIRPFGTAAPVLTQATNVAGSVVGGAASALNPALANVNSALAQVSGLTGGLLSTIMANVASALGAVNDLGNPQAAAASLVNNAGGLLSNINTLAENVPQAGAGVNTLAGNLVGNAAGIAASAATILGGNVIPAATAPVGNIAGLVGNLGLVREIKEQDRTITHITTIINGKPTFLPVITTTLNGRPTAVPVINTVVNGAPTDLPILNGGPGQLARLFGRSRLKQDKLEQLRYEDWLEESDGRLLREW